MIIKASRKRKVFVYFLSFILASSMAVLPAGAWADPVGEVPDSIGAGVPGSQQGAENPTDNTNGSGGQSSDEGDPGGGIPGEGGSDEGDPGGGGSDEGGTTGGSYVDGSDGDGTTSGSDEGGSDEDGNTEEGSDEGVDEGEADDSDPNEGDQSEGIPLIPLADSWVTYSTASALSNNLWGNDYPTYGATVKSTLNPLPSGGLERVEWINNRLIVEEYTQSFTFVSGKEILANTYTPSDVAAGQGAIWGGFYSGASFNYVVTGQENYSENDGLTVIRVTQYTKDWQYVSNYELKGGNTTIPFNAGSLRMTELGGNLYIRACHTLYKTPDGKNHQTNLSLVLDSATLAFVGGFWDVFNIEQSPYGFVSHSFNQFLGVLNGKIYGVDHGDADPTRAITVKSIGDADASSYSTIYPFTGESGDNVTSASVGGFETSSTRGTLLIAGNSADQILAGSTTTPQQYERNIWLTVTSADLSTTITKSITSYADEGDTWGSTPQLVKINEDRFLVMWGVGRSSRAFSSTSPSRSLGDTINYVFVDGNGNPLSPVYSATGRLSDCQPIVVGGKIIWYVTGDSSIGATAPVFYSIDASSGDDTFYIAPSLSTILLADGAVGTPYSEALSFSGTEPITWVVSSGSLPDGLSLTTAGEISGTPTAVGIFIFTVSATNIFGNATSNLLYITVAAAPEAPIITTSSLMGGTAGVAYSQMLVASGTGPITWAIASGSLPAGLSLSSAGIISGIPTATGTSTFDVSATNGITSVTKSLSIYTAGASEPADITMPNFAVGMVGVPYYQIITANGTQSIYWFHSSGTLPDGLTLSLSGIVSGIPTTTGTFNFMLQAMNGSGGNMRSFSITIVAAPVVLVVPTITTSSLTGGTVGTSYSQALSATGTVPITWSLDSGNLPDGLTLSTAGVISGTPTVAGTSNFTVQASNAVGNTTKPLSITVAFMASDNDTIVVEDLTADMAFVKWVYDHASRTVTVYGDVVVIGSEAGADATLTFDIGYDTTVSWEADLYGDAAFVGDLLVLKGAGAISLSVGTLSTGNGNTVVVDGTSAIEVTLGGASIMADGAFSAVLAQGAEITISGGTVLAYEGTAIKADAVTVLSGSPVTVSQTGATAAPAILLDGLLTVSGEDLTVNGEVSLSGVLLDSAGSITINGSVNASGHAIVAYDSTSVVVNGNINAVGDGILAHWGASVEVNGNITSGGYGVNAGNNPLDAYDTAVSVVVNGDIYADSTGIFARADASVEVTGSVVSTGGFGIWVMDEASVEVTGSVAGGTGIWVVDSYGASVKVGGNLDAFSNGISINSASHHGTIAFVGSSVVVNGNVDAVEVGIIAGSESSVEVGGNVDAGYIGIDAYEAASVKVNGSVTTGGLYVSGISAFDRASVEVNGSVRSNGIGAVGVSCDYYSTVTVDSTITASHYIMFFHTDYLTAADYDAVSLKPGYTQYSGISDDNLPSYVWVGGKSPEDVLKLYYSTHVQNVGWLPFVPEGEVSGTVGPGLRLEGLKVNLVNTTGYKGGISYSTHIQNVGWQAPVTVQTDGSSTAVAAMGDLSGTEGQGLRLEAVRMELTGELGRHFDIYYRVHAQSVGWMGWAKNGTEAGTAGLGLRLEAIQVCLVYHGGPVPADTYGGVSAPAGAPRMIDPAAVSAGLRYKATVHVQNIGDITYSSANGIAQIGTSGQGLRLEAMTLELIDRPEAGWIKYETHIQNIGWQGYRQEGVLSGTMGPGLRLEAVRIQLTDDMAAEYDVYYRTHVQNIGWTGWAKNGQSCGSANYGYRMEAMQILIVPKGLAPGFNTDYFYQ